MQPIRRPLGLLVAILAISSPSVADAQRAGGGPRVQRMHTRASTVTPTPNPDWPESAPLCSKGEFGFPGACTTESWFLTYWGGNVIPNVKVYVVNWGASVDPVIGAHIGEFYSAVTNSPFLDWLNEYNTGPGTLHVKVGGGQNQGSASPAQVVGRGTFAGYYTITPAANTSSGVVDDTQISAELDAQIGAGNLPAPDANTIYMTYFPPGLVVSQGGDKSCGQSTNSFCAYHNSFLHGSLSVKYAVYPDFGAGSGCDSGCGFAALSEFDNVSTVSSHELAEAVTDADVGQVTATTFDYPGAFYNLASDGSSSGEIADICSDDGSNSNPAGLITGFDGTKYAVQELYSNTTNQCETVRFDPQDFTVYANPNAVSVSPGGSASVPLTLATTSGAAQSVAVAVSGLPSGVTASAIGTVSSDSTPALTFTATAGAAPTKDAVVVITAVGATSHSASVLLSVAVGAPNTFTVGVSPAAQTVAAGGTTSFTVTTASTGGAAESITLSASGLPAGLTAVFNPPSVTAGASSTLTLTAAVGAGSVSAASFSIVGTSPSSTATTHATITVTGGSAASTFSLDVTPDGDGTLATTGTATWTVTATLGTGSPQPVTLSIAGLPSTIRGVFSPATVTPDGTAHAQSTLTLTSTAAADDTISFTVTGKAASDTESASGTVTVGLGAGSFTVSIDPATQGIKAMNGTAVYTVKTTAGTGSAKKVDLTVDGLPSSITAAFTPASVTAGGSSTLTLTTVDASGDPGENSFTVSGTIASTSELESVNATVVVTENDYTLTMTPTARSVAAGATTTFLVKTAKAFGAAEGIQLQVNGLDAVTASFDNDSPTTGDSATLTVSVDPGTSPMVLPFTVTGLSSSSVVHVVSGTLTITGATANDFTIAIAPDTLTLAAGGSAHATVTTAVSAGTGELIQLTLTGVPAGVNYSFSPTHVTGAGTSTLTLTAGSGVAALSGTVITVTGTSPSTAHAADATLDLTAALATPTAILSAPIEGATVTGSLVMTAAATVDAATTLASIDFYVDSMKVGSTTTTPGSFTWDSSSVANGAHAIKAVAVDAAGDSGASAVANVTVSNTGSSTIAVAVSAPAAGTTLTGTVTVTATATGAITGISLLVDGASIGSGGTAPFSQTWDTTLVANGAHTITATAHDSAGHSATSAAVSVTVANTGTGTGGAGSPAKSGCSTGPGGVELFSLLGLAGLVRFRRRRSESLP